MAADYQEEYAERVREQMQDAGDVVYAPITEAEAGEGVSWRVTEAGVAVSLDGSEPPEIALEKAKRVEAELKPQLKSILSEAELKWVKERQEQEVAALRQVKRFNPDSLQARFSLERVSLLRELRKAYVQMVLFYTKPEGGNNSLEDAIRLAGVKIKGTQEAKRLYKQMGRRPPDQISWYQLNDLFLCDPEAAEYFWQDIKEAARKDVESGHYLARVFENTDWMSKPWQRAEFQAIRDGFIAEWGPRGQIELCMIDAMAVSFYLFLYWTGEHNKRTKLDARMVSQDYKEWWDRNYKHWSRNDETYKTKYSGQYHDGYWDMPYQKEADAIQQAAELADRFRREFFAGVRQLRDWRRYSSPVIVQNAGQVNIAADGGQQVNLQKKKQSRKRKATTRTNKSEQSRKRATKPEPKQLGQKSPEESIRMDLASETVQLD